ncbi:MAG TPA: zinc-binding dehydrogenase, partial [Chloroflexota bacterium]|nr:zinc-binding dehydrogenase [Chloroflexota bacterium]
MSVRIPRRVAQIVKPHKIEIVEDSLELGPHEVAVKIAACGICSWESGFYSGQRPTELPRPIGHEPAGVVEAVGSEVTTWKPGDRVAGLFYPAFATHAKAKDTMLVRVPDHLPLEHAIVEPVKCIVTGLRAARPDFGDHALVVGCGFMGLLCVAGLRSFGVASLTAVDMLDERLERARRLGATNVLNPTRDNVVAAVGDITSGHGIDVAMEASTVPAGFALAAQTLRRGQANLVVVTTAYPGTTYDVTALLSAGAIVHFAEPGHCLDPIDELRRTIEALGRGVFPMAELITHRFSLDEIGKGMDAGLSREPGYIKGIVVP